MESSGFFTNIFVELLERPMVMNLVNTAVNSVLVELRLFRPPFLRQIVGADVNHATVESLRRSFDVDVDGILITEPLEHEWGQYVAPEFVKDNGRLAVISVPKSVVAII